jgi:hypothetical protein
MTHATQLLELIERNIDVIRFGKEV